MKRLLAGVLAILAGTCAVYAQSVRNVDVKAVLSEDGSARITQVWDVSVVEGTEWYIPISNLGKMTVKDLTVSENGETFINEGRDWDVNRSLAQKAGRCGIIDKHDGVELCWGQGSYGPHVWTAEFTVTGLVQSFSDADGFNFMFVNPGLVAPPQHVKVTIVNATGGPEWTYDNTLDWGFGSYGDINVEDGSVVYESSEPFSYNSSVIVLTRFEKGLFTPTVSRDMTFDELKERALDGSSYSNGDDPIGRFILALFALIFGGSIFVLIRAAVLTALGYKYKKSMFGKTKITEWYREAPMDGNLFASSFVLDSGQRFPSGNSSSRGLIGALFLRWILDGKVKVLPDANNTKRVNLDFTHEPDIQDDVELALYNMAREASGANLLLESGEFEKWSERNFKKMTAWPTRARARGQGYMHDKHYFRHGTTTNDDGAREACRVIEFKNFLNDFTLSKERGAAEVGLWKDYLVFAQLYGIADKVATQFQKLFPKEFQEIAQSVGVDPNVMMRTIRLNNNMSASAINRAVAKQQAGSIRGTGGHTSFGGGGGFSGGGFGGGSR
ncbi:MAG: DUF2207 domain-containing protein [Bacteroidales bacterium]|nr:DUF2207 domain-containing protein [Bacteroidales bacterium]